MTWNPANDPQCITDCNSRSFETVIVPRRRDVEVLMYNALCPQWSAGPLAFVFFDRFGPLKLVEGRSLEVRPHPHIGLATVTYLFAGAIMHRESLGNVQVIRPDEVNWMTAGRGIVHSERASEAGNPPETELFGIQTWVALPKAQEEIDGGFAHHADGEFPLIEGEGVWVKVVLGEVFGHRSPVATFGDPVYVDYRLQSRARLVLPAKIEERALSVVSGELEIDGQRFEPGTLVVLKPKSEVVARADISTQLVLLGGPKLDGPRHVWWNFVSSSKERIEAPRRTGVQGDFLRCPAITNSFHWPE